MTKAKPTTRKRKRANAEGAIYEDKARNRWRGSLTLGYENVTNPDGTTRRQQVRRTVTGKTRAEVAQRLRELQGAADAGQAEDLARADLTVKRFLDAWLATLDGSVAASTARQYHDVARLYVAPHLGRHRVRSLKPSHVRDMLRALEVEGRSANTRRLARSILRRALRWGEQEGIIVRNVAAIAEGVKLQAEEGRTLSPTQARALLDHVQGSRLEAAFTIMLGLGLRRGEVLGLAWDDLDLDAAPARLTVRRALKRIGGRGLVLEDPKTSRSRRTVHVPPFVVESLRAHRKRQAEERLAAGPVWVADPGADLIFRTPRGSAVDPANLLHAVYEATEAALGERWSAHEMRHSAASLMLATLPLKSVSEALGHSSIRITADVYGHLLEPARAEVADAMEVALGRTV